MSEPVDWLELEAEIERQALDEELAAMRGLVNGLLIAAPIDAAFVVLLILLLT